MIGLLIKQLGGKPWEQMFSCEHFYRTLAEVSIVREKV